jgi:hypothetical protein
MLERLSTLAHTISTRPFLVQQSAAKSKRLGIDESCANDGELTLPKTKGQMGRRQYHRRS